MMYAYVSDGTVRRVADVPTGAPGWLTVFDALPTYDPPNSHPPPNPLPRRVRGFRISGGLMRAGTA